MQLKTAINNHTLAKAFLIRSTQGTISSCGHKGFMELLKSNAFDLPYEAELQTPPIECKLCRANANSAERMHTPKPLNF